MATGRMPARLAAAMLAAAGGVAAAPSAGSFDTIFAVAGEPATLHYRAAYLVRGSPHSLEVWRDHDRRVRRTTDGTVTTVATHRPGDPEFSLTIVDPGKRTVTTIDRTNLYRLGNFTDWFDLTHGLRHPRGRYAVTAGSPPRGALPAIAACGWYDLTAGPAVTHVCWDRTDRLPLLIVAADGAPVWRITAVDRKPLAADVFRIVDPGFVRVDANRDLDRD